MKLHIVIVIILVGLAFGGGWVASAYTKTKEASAPTTAENTQTSPPATNDTTEPPSTVYDIYSGTGLTYDELYQTLGKLTGKDFDMRYINYSVLLQGYTAALNRIAKDQALAPALRDRAALSLAQDRERMDNLFAIQKQLGYSHH